MTRLICTILLALQIAGCASIPRSSSESPSPAEHRKKLARAIELVRTGNNVAAANLLTSICKEKGMAGITDEALFRLGLLTIRLGGDRETAFTTLERLQREFPSSEWAKTAAPVIELLAQHEDLRNQNRSLKNTNQLISRENRELLQNIERLKSLDIELERKPKVGK